MGAGSSSTSTISEHRSAACAWLGVETEVRRGRLGHDRALAFSKLLSPIELNAATRASLGMIKFRRRHLVRRLGEGSFEKFLRFGLLSPLQLLWQPTNMLSAYSLPDLSALDQLRTFSTNGAIFSSRATADEPRKEHWHGSRQWGAA